MPVRVGLRYIDIWDDSLEDAVREYEAEPIIKDQIVFYGPSYFTRWSAKWNHAPLRDVMLGNSGAQCSINRGFGSSCPEHQLYYYPRMIRPLEPRVLVYGCIGNSSAFGYSDEEAFELAQRVIMYALTDFPDLRVYLMGAKGKMNMNEENLAKFKVQSDMVREFAEATPRCHFVDPLAYEPLRRNDIYVKDGVHYNREGYDIFADFWRDALKDELVKY